MKKISIITPTFNEELNINLLYEKIKNEFNKINYEYEHIVIDNCSTDNTIPILRELCKRDKRLKVTDFYALSDVTMSAEMTTYRQALRDLPSNYTTSDSLELAEDLSNLNWPTKP